jgi:hydroxymethylpyrimidine pyrophosphatase-like HAD family hydrolase
MAIMGPACTKASGVVALARTLGIPLEQVMAIGDNNNDIEMLREVGWGIAMGQASERVKTSAHAVTASNAEDGVALAIERYALTNTTTCGIN